MQPGSAGQKHKNIMIARNSPDTLVPRRRHGSNGSSFLESWLGASPQTLYVTISRQAANLTAAACRSLLTVEKNEPY